MQRAARCGALAVGQAFRRGNRGVHPREQPCLVWHEQVALDARQLVVVVETKVHGGTLAKGTDQIGTERRGGDEDGRASRCDGGKRPLHLGENDASVPAPDPFDVVPWQCTRIDDQARALTIGGRCLPR